MITECFLTHSASLKLKPSSGTSNSWELKAPFEFASFSAVGDVLKNPSECPLPPSKRRGVDTRLFLRSSSGSKHLWFCDSQGVFTFFSSFSVLKVSLPSPYNRRKRRLLGIRNYLTPWLLTALLSSVTNQQKTPYALPPPTLSPTNTHTHTRTHSIHRAWTHSLSSSHLTLLLLICAPYSFPCLNSKS